MADYPAIAAMSEAVLGLLESAAVGTEFATATFSHYQAGDFESPMTDGVSLYLYRVTVKLEPQPAESARTRRHAPPPADPARRSLPRDPVGGDAIRQQRMLGFAIRTLEDTPILPAGSAQPVRPGAGRLPSRGDGGARVREPSRYRTWPTSGMSRRPRSNRRRTYVARMVEIESRVRVDGGPAVQTRELRFARRKWQVDCVRP